MKKVNSYKVIYLFALILNLTLFKWSINFCDEKEPTTVSMQQDYRSKLTYVNSSNPFKMSFTLTSDIFSPLGNIRNSAPRIEIDILKGIDSEDYVSFPQLTPIAISTN